VPNGDAYQDNCGECDNNVANDCIEDCFGVWGGESVLDDCGVCDGGNLDVDDCGICFGYNEDKDCSGTCFGDSELDNCGECDNNPGNDCIEDCFGVWGGESVLDDCGVCDGGNLDVDDCGVCFGYNEDKDCAGVCFGDAEPDNCGVCDDDPTNDCVLDCNGEWGGIGVLDDCGICSGGSSNHVFNSDIDSCGQCFGNNEAKDDCGICFGNNEAKDECGVCFGDNEDLDECGVCFGDNTSCMDCANIPNGDAYFDNCGICDADPANDCVPDCNGVWGGIAVLDNCGICDADPYNNCIEDCFGVWGGNSELDECGICDGHNTTCMDCAGIPNGISYFDDCGICDDDIFNDCTQDCNGVWGGVAVLDNCGVCGGENYNLPCGVYDVSVEDVDPDQGYQLFISFKKSFYDTDTLITRSEMYTVELKSFNGNWVSVQTIGAYGESLYTILVPTLENNIETEYRIIANMDEGNFVSSENIVGMSIDNILPETPSNLLAAAGFTPNPTMFLAWDYEHETDFAYHLINSFNNNYTTIENNIEIDIELPYNEYFINSVDINSNLSIKSEFVSVYELHEGNNLISFSVLPENNSIYNIFEGYELDIIAVVGEGVASMNESYISEVDDPELIHWFGTLTNFSHSKGYWVQANQDIMLVVKGLRGVVNEFSIHQGPNLLSYTCENSANVSSAINNDCISGIVGEGKATTFIDEIGWVGSLHTLESGRGYWYFSNCQNSILSYDCPEENFARKEHIEINREYYQSMEQSFYFIEDIEGVEIGDIVEIYNGDILVGSNVWIGAYTDIPVMGNDQSKFTLDYCETGCVPKLKLVNQNNELYDLEIDLPAWKSNEIIVIDGRVSKKEIPINYELYSPYPNPFNPITNIDFSLPRKSLVNLSVYDINGQLIEVLINANKNSGQYTAQWNAMNIASGVYFIKLEVENFSSSQKIILLK